MFAVRRLVVGVGAVASLVLQVGPPVARAAEPGGVGPCANVDVEYSPSRVRPASTMELFMEVDNCSPYRERILVDVHATGPCDFGHPEPSVYAMEPLSGSALFALMVAPDCPGQYRLAVIAVVHGVALDTSRTGFNVIGRGPDQT